MKKFCVIIFKCIIWLIIFFPIFNMFLFSFIPEHMLSDFFQKLKYFELDNILGEIVKFRYTILNFAFMLENKILWRQFLNSVLYTSFIVIIQLVISIAMGFVFAKLNFKFKNVIFFLYILVMATPYTVYLIPYNIMFKALGIMDTFWCVILPFMFFPFGAFFFRQSIISLNNDLIEAALIDGANYLLIIVKIIIPNIAPSIISFILINVTETWNLLEPFLAFVQSSEKHSLSVVLHDMATTRPEAIFSPSVLYMIPPLIVYIVFDFINRRDMEKTKVI